MANQGKRRAAATPEERARLLRWIATEPRESARFQTLSVDETGTFLGFGPKTLYRARQERDGLLAEDPPVDPAPDTLASLPYIAPLDGMLQFSYSMLEVRNFQARRLGIPLTDTSTAPAATFVPEGLTAFLAHALPTDEWPCSIQEDGRPIDFYYAIEAGLLTGHAERLSLAEFVERLAHTAPAAFARAEADELRAIVPDPEEGLVEESEDDDA